MSSLTVLLSRRHRQLLPTAAEEYFGWREPFQIHAPELAPDVGRSFVRTSAPGRNTQRVSSREARAADTPVMVLPGRSRAETLPDTRRHSTVLENGTSLVSTCANGY
jgi:hypothetical protein